MSWCAPPPPPVFPTGADVSPRRGGISSPASGHCISTIEPRFARWRPVGMTGRGTAGAARRFAMFMFCFDRSIIQFRLTPWNCAVFRLTENKTRPVFLPCFFTGLVARRRTKRDMLRFPVGTDTQCCGSSPGGYAHFSAYRVSFHIAPLCTPASPFEATRSRPNPRPDGGARPERCLFI